MRPDTLAPDNTAAPAGPADLVLIVEDDARIADMLANYLHMHGFATRIEADGLLALQFLEQTLQQGFGQKPDLMLLDLMLPGLDGIALCRALRAFSDLPVLMLTARVDEIDRLVGLETGADDYVCKPFSPREVVARIQALLRRAQGRLRPAGAGSGAQGAVSGPLASAWLVDEAAQRVLCMGQPLNLTPLEFRLLRLLLSRPGQVFSRARLLDAVHSDLRDVSDRAIDSHIKNLRKKIEAARPSPAAGGIGSVYGVGYRFEITS